MSEFIKKIPKSKLKEFYTYDIQSAVDSVRNPGKSREPVELPKGDSLKKPFLVVFRHGQSEDNIKRIYSGWRNSPLTEQGRAQAKLLEGQLHWIEFDYHFCSPLDRSRETLEIALGKRKFKPIVEWRITERNYGDLTGRSKLHLLKKDPMLAVLTRRSWSYPPPNGESDEMVYSRVVSFLKELEYTLKKEKKSAVICTSSHPMRSIRMHYEGLSAQEAMAIENPTGQDYCLYNL